ncbi:PREDICTED: cleavage stimulating factor 64-like isoform X2 [Brassica oleracea var. oleracea]|uniref:Cleavage stimulation factor subunit 2 hinge domain-containing protein n=1 Tax=Brassica oleracea var. oleracea TaxID=109376 RepID=A0A0D3CWT3_BRAOL|nr:PREDICTED: cleavage stimulating factor 64-like isoform X2 [Brassica oleracea var. oleracea]
MAGKQIGAEGGVPENLAGMTKSQLYDIMSQMKTLIDQNHEQAREILIRNPLLTKALFQAQIMLGMVQPPQVPKVDPLVAAQPQQSRQSIPTKPNVNAHVSSVQGGEPAATMQPQAPIRKHPMQQQQPMPMPMPLPPPPSVSATSNAPSQPRFSLPQRHGHLNPAGSSLSHPQSSQVQNAPPLAPHHPTSQQPQFHHLDIPASSTQLQQQQPMHSVGGSHLAQQQPRPYHHQFGPSQPGPNAAFQHHGAPPQHHSQPMFHSGNRPPASGGPQFPQGQPHLPSQPPYQGGGQFRGDYNNNQLGGPMAAERGPWMASQPESSNITHLPGLGPAPPPSQVGPGGGPPPRPAPISADMEKALLQQVMSLTPEQINLLPPEQRNQVLQLQQILRQ